MVDFSYVIVEGVFSCFCNLILQEFYSDFKVEKDIEKFIEKKIKKLEKFTYSSPKKLSKTFNLIDEEGWVAFNIKETFLYNTDESGFSKLIRELIFSKYLNINHLDRYRHRLSIEGIPLYYFSVVCWKKADIPFDFIKKLNIQG